MRRTLEFSTSRWANQNAFKIILRFESHILLPLLRWRHEFRAGWIFGCLSQNLIDGSVIVVGKSPAKSLLARIQLRR
jgi:hypothetical protein